MYAVIETGGKQYRVKEGDVLYVEKLPGEKNSDNSLIRGVEANSNIQVSGKVLMG